MLFEIILLVTLLVPTSLFYFIIENDNNTI